LERDKEKKVGEKGSSKCTGQVERDRICLGSAVSRKSKKVETLEEGGLENCRSPQKKKAKGKGTRIDLHLPKKNGKCSRGLDIEKRNREREGKRNPSFGKREEFPIDMI